MREIGSINSSGSGSTVARCLQAVIVMALAGALPGCNVIRPWPAYESSAPLSSQQPTSANEWIGKTLPELTAKLGRPTSVQPLLETTGQLIFYARPGQPHYVFEAGPNGKIVSATATD